MHFLSFCICKFAYRTLSIFKSTKTSFYVNFSDFKSYQAPISIAKILEKCAINGLKWLLKWLFWHSYNRVNTVFHILFCSHFSLFRPISVQHLYSFCIQILETALQLMMRKICSKSTQNTNIFPKCRKPSI